MMKKIKSVFTTVVDWVATLFGMKNDSTKYSRMLRRIVGTGFALVVIFWTLRAAVELLDELDWSPSSLFSSDDDEYYVQDRLTDDLVFYGSMYNDLGYVANAKGKKLVKDVEWVVGPKEGDSLVCYSDGQQRGYFHLRDGHLVVKPQYSHAWIFSEGLAAVVREGKIQFIDAQGQPAMGKRFGFVGDGKDFVFRNGLCAVYDSNGQHMGLIDHQGDWVIEPRYESILPIDTFWHVRLDNQEAVLTYHLDTVIPLTPASLEIDDTVIYAIYSDHTKSTFGIDGRLKCKNEIDEAELMQYDTREVLYPNATDDEDDYVTYDSDERPTRKAVATCLRYEAELGWYGLMSPEGHVVTPPSYVRIEAVDKDLYLCFTHYNRAILLNSRGQRVE